MCTKDVIGQHRAANGLAANIPNLQGNMSGTCHTHRQLTAMAKVIIDIIMY